MSNGNDDVVTPGGRRPPSEVHEVAPGQAVAGTGEVVGYDVTAGPSESAGQPAESGQGASAVPAGMAPESDPAQGSAPEGMYPSAAGDAGPQAAPAGMFPGAAEAAAGAAADREPDAQAPKGMHPDLAAAPTAAAAMAAGEAGEELVRTPGGYRHVSVVHRIEPGHRLDLGGGTVRQLHPEGNEVADFGAVDPHTPGRPLMPANVTPQAGMVPALAEGWISYAYWTNNTGHPTTRFATTWVVPPAPATNHNQTIFLFNGIQNSTFIYQPVLQWGPSAAGGGARWTIASWYVDGQGGPAFHTNLINVNPGDVLVGVMTLTGQSAAGFSYNCEFQGIANTSLPITNVEELTWNIETLEAYGVQQASDYPDTNFTAFVGIDLRTGAGHPAITWTAVNAVTDTGQSTRIVSNANPGGEVDIYYTTRVSSSASTAAINSDGRLETFLRATNGSVWNIWQTHPHAGPWSRTNQLGGIVKQAVCSALNTDGRLEIFGIGTDGAAYNMWQANPHAGPWQGWNRLGGWVSKLAVACNSDGRLELFGIGSDGALYNMWQTHPHAGPWSGWNRLGGWVKDICVSLNSDGRLEVFGIGSDNALYNMWQTNPHAGPWSGWNRLGGWVSQIASTVNSDGRLEVFGIGSDNALYNMWQTVPHAGPWSGWNRLGGWVKQVVPTRNSDGRLEVFGIGSDNALYNMWQANPHAGPWSGWNKLGGWVSQISAALNSDGRLEAFGVGSDQDLYNMWQTHPHAGPWSGWNKLT